LDRCKAKIGHFFDTFGQVSNFGWVVFVAYRGVSVGGGGYAGDFFKKRVFFGQFAIKVSMFGFVFGWRLLSQKF
jgi:hypothetical protein